MGGRACFGLVLSGRVYRRTVFLFRAGALALALQRRRLNERFQRGRLEAEPIAGEPVGEELVSWTRVRDKWNRIHRGLAGLVT